MPEILPKAFGAHNHKRCAHDALSSADTVCRDRKLRMTPVRRKVLEVLLEAHKALGAYDVLDRLADAGFAAQPPVAYRALEFLVESGFVHRVESLNAYVACMHPTKQHSPNFMICRKCHVVAEQIVKVVDTPLQDSADAIGFKIETAVVEAEGLCPNCQDGS